MHNIIEKVKEAGQEAVLRFWSELTESQKQTLVAQLAEIDFGFLEELKSSFLQKNKNELHDKLEPARFVQLPETHAEKSVFERAGEIGRQALKNGKVASFLVAGGQGTRLGFGGPKGKFPISPVQNKTLFQLHAEKISAISRRYGYDVPWYIMTSETNHNETVSYFEENNYFGLSAANVMCFKQGMVPALTSDGELVLEAKDRFFRNPNGHGGALAALNVSGALVDMQRRGIDYIFYFQVDNVLINICDPVFVGFHIQHEAEMSAKVVRKRDPQEKVGVIGQIDGKLGVIEYSDLSEEQQNLRNADGSLKFQAGSIAIHIFNRDFVERLNEGGFHLPWHVAHKKIPFLDTTGNRVQPESPNAYKFETFVFDALTAANKALILEVAREEEFSPIKNATGVDSALTARQHIIERFQRWMQVAGLEVSGKPIEISALAALDVDEFVEKVKSGSLKIGNSYIGQGSS